MTLVDEGGGRSSSFHQAIEILRKAVVKAVLGHSKFGPAQPLLPAPDSLLPTAS